MRVVDIEPVIEILETVIEETGKRGNKFGVKFCSELKKIILQLPVIEGNNDSKGD